VEYSTDSCQEGRQKVPAFEQMTEFEKAAAWAKKNKKKFP
jgi:hypothetical protein